MPYVRPSLAEIDKRILADLTSRVRKNGDQRGQSAPVLRRSALSVLARANAGAHHMEYAFLEWLARQRFVHSMDDEFLDQEGAQFEVPRKQADYARGQAAATGNPGATITAGTLYHHADGQQYIVQQTTELSNGTATIAVKAVAVGAAGNLFPGDVIRPVASLAGVFPDAIVGPEGIHSGVDAESDDYYRERIWDRKRKPPQGGAKHDYEAWAKEVPGVTRAWCLPLWMGIGTVGVMFTRDNDLSPIPNEDQCAAVWNHIESLRPVTANEIFVFPPVEHKIDVAAKLYPNDEVTRNAVAAELAEFLFRDGAPDAVLFLSRLTESISIAAGEHHHRLTAPIHDIPIGKNELPTLGRLVFEDWP